MTGWPCHRCGRPSVIAVLRLPRTWTTAAGDPVPVISERHLCTRCDAATDCDEAAAVLLSWITGEHPAPDVEAPPADTDVRRELDGG